MTSTQQAAESKCVDFVTNATASDRIPHYPEYFEVRLTQAFLDQVERAKSVLESGEFGTVTLGLKASLPDMYWGKHQTNEHADNDLVRVEMLPNGEVDVRFSASHRYVDEAEMWATVSQERLQQAFRDTPHEGIAFFTGESGGNDEYLRLDYYRDADSGRIHTPSMG